MQNAGFHLAGVLPGKSATPNRW